MKVAVVGVGLIGGSIGLAARERLGAEVAGFDPGGVDAALDVGAIDRAARPIDPPMRPTPTIAIFTGR